MKKVLWVIGAILAILIGLYPSLYFLVKEKFGLLLTKSPTLLANGIWWTAFYMHIVFGGIALLVGWSQFNSQWRKKYLNAHRLIGKIYVFTVLMSGLGGAYIAFFATGGWLNSLGFGLLDIIWVYSTWRAFTDAKNKNIPSHQRMMIYSYAACFAAVTLRLWLPLLMMIFNDMEIAYGIVAWLCWVPNLLVAYKLTENIPLSIEASYC
jgi:uncharacterized membrane protein